MYLYLPYFQNQQLKEYCTDITLHSWTHYGLWAGGVYITHNATWPLIVVFKIQVCSASCGLIRLDFSFSYLGLD